MGDRLMIAYCMGAALIVATAMIILFVLIDKKAKEVKEVERKMR